MDYAYFNSINSSGSGPVEGASGDGSLANPFNVPGAIQYVQENGDTETSGAVYVKGTVSKIQTQFSASNVNGTFWISEDGVYHENDNTKDFEAYQVKWLGNSDWTTDNSKPAKGDEVIIYGKLTKYTNKSGKSTYETSGGGQAYVYSWKGQTEDPGTGGGSGSGGGDTSDYETDLSKINALADNSAAKFEGIVTATSTISLIVSDGTNNVYVYRPTTMAVNGDKVRVDGTKVTYGGVTEIDSNATVTVVSQNNAFSYPSPKVITSTFDSYAATAVEYIEFTGTLAKSGNYYNVNVAGAEAHVGSISYPASDLLANMDGQNVTFTGYFVGLTSKNKYVNLVCVKAVVASGGGDTGGGTGGGGTGGGGSQGGGGDTGGEKVVTFTYDNSTSITTTGAAQTQVINDITLRLENGARNANNTDIRIYKDKTMTISTSVGNIKKIVITSSAKDNGCDKFGTGAPNGFTVTSASEGTWTGSATSVEFKASSAQVRMKTIQVTYE